MKFYVDHILKLETSTSCSHEKTYIIKESGIVACCFCYSQWLFTPTNIVYPDGVTLKSKLLPKGMMIFV